MHIFDNLPVQIVPISSAEDNLGDKFIDVLSIGENTLLVGDELYS